MAFDFQAAVCRPILKKDIAAWRFLRSGGTTPAPEFGVSVYQTIAVPGFPASWEACVYTDDGKVHLDDGDWVVLIPTPEFVPTVQRGVVKGVVKDNLFQAMFDDLSDPEPRGR